MMKRNGLEIEATPLNLNLNGSQINQPKSNVRRNSVTKAPIQSNRSSLSASNSNLSSNQTRKNIPIPKSDNISISNRQQLSNRKGNISMINPFLKKNHENEFQDIQSAKQSNIFMPSSIASSIDDTENLRKQNEKKKSQVNANELDYFFNLIPDAADLSGHNNSTATNRDKAEKENNLFKLKSSVENLRRELEVETSKFEKDVFFKRNDENKRKEEAAFKIQKWYRIARKNQLNKQKDIQEMFNQKKSEMIKRNQKYDKYLQKPDVKKKTVSQRFHSENNDKKSPRQSKMNDSISVTKPQNDNKKETNESLQSNEFISFKKDNLKTYMKDNLPKPINELLLDLEKLDNDSQNLLNLPTDSNSIASSNLNNILSYLDEAAANPSNSFTPRVFKDINFEDLMIKDDAINEKKNSKELKQSKKISEESDSFTNRNSIKSSRDKSFNSKKEDKQPKFTPIQKPTRTYNNEDQSDKNENQSHIIEEAESSNKQQVLHDLELDEKNRKIAVLEKALLQQRELTIRHAKESEKELQMRLEAQKNDYETTIQRHLGFIDQLIDDKKVLSEKCEKLVKELKDIEKTYSDRHRTTEERNKYEMQKLKDTFEAAEKIRREKWIEEKTKKIKEMTIKGLEPEIQGLITKHKSEIKSLKSIHEAELLQADERAAQRYIKITEELRENYDREKESFVQKERELCKQRYEKSLEEEEKSFLEQRRRLYAEIEEEKNRIAEQGAIQRKELDKLRKALEENNSNSIETLRKEYAQIQNELERKHQIEIQNLKEKLSIEKESWEQNYMKKQENWILQKERDLKDQIKKDRDKEIELLITKFESESSSVREEADRTAENRIKRIRDKYESELKEVEKTERETMERYNIIKSKYNELEGEYERLKVLIKQKDKDLEGIKKLTDTLQDERNRLADVIRQDFTDRIIYTEEENKRVKLEIAELKSRQQYELDKKKEEIDKIQKEKIDELNTLQEKIKQVIAKKDETFSQLKQQYESATKRADHLEGLLEQQRLLMVKKQANNN